MAFHFIVYLRPEAHFHSKSQERNVTSDLPRYFYNTEHNGVRFASTKTQNSTFCFTWTAAAAAAATTTALHETSYVGIKARPPSLWTAVGRRTFLSNYFRGGCPLGAVDTTI
jgi:hypothetical protein